MMPDQLIHTLRLLREALNSVGISYAIGGSVASSTRGAFRATLGVDLVVTIEPPQAQLLHRELGPDWYADLDHMLRSIEAGRSFNLIHMTTAQKVDLFPAQDAFRLAQISHAVLEEIGFLGERDTFPVLTVEDIVLAKLQWYRDGGCVSDRQWRDITELVAINPALDRQYLAAWATRLGLSSLLSKALEHPGREA